MNKNKTIITKSDSTLNWYIVDAKDKNLGRLSSKIAHILKDKNSIEYLPYQAGNTNIIIINSKGISVTGKKRKQKTYKRHSGRPGGLKVEVFEKLQKRIPNRIIEHAIRGMLPKNSLGRKLFKKIKIYQDDIHPHASQKPISLNIN
uniref:Large ribosomal subunit protein uL13c n=1 Tax=Rhodomela confervoides TaxID=35163 RepID=A0A1Z1MA32_RHOCN|nr:ribosomal protein L13 [Rhodomela confervoides]ARW62752.1 ribosomal protein L13 [Rhodomela confervoides]